MSTATRLDSSWQLDEPKEWQVDKLHILEIDKTRRWQEVGYQQSMHQCEYDSDRGQGP
jgi:hypothetical protein